MIIPVSLGERSYDIVVERGALGKINTLLDLDRKVLIVTDSGVPADYSETVKSLSKEGYIFTVPSGEESKSISTFEKLLCFMLEKGFSRKDCVVAVGGGVVGDLSGFTAACYMRGIDFYNLPTTVLSQVDSSIGGKTAVNLSNIKNIVGAFYQPKKVVIDPDTLKTLPARQISNGLAEAVKMSLTSDKELFDIFENGDIYGSIDVIIERSLKIKRYVVEQDERESGLRKILNFGHTVGHGVESEGAKSGMYHGECVAIGMVAMCGENVRKRLLKVLNKLSLPVCCDFDAKAIYDAVLHDKKASGGKIDVITVNEIASFEIVSTTPDKLYEKICSIVKVSE